MQTSSLHVFLSKEIKVNPSIYLNNDQFVDYLFSQIWTTRIGGQLGIHESTLPKIWSGTGDIFSGVVPGVGYSTTYMDNSTPAVRAPDRLVLERFVRECPLGLMIVQYTYVEKPFQKVIHYRNLYVKVNEYEWAYDKKVQTIGVDPTPWGAEQMYI